MKVNQQGALMELGLPPGSGMVCPQMAGQIARYAWGLDALKWTRRDGELVLESIPMAQMYKEPTPTPSTGAPHK